MLCFVFTDAPIAAPVLQTLVADGADRTFNCVTVDGDTSTSDTLLVFATGEAEKRGCPRIDDATDPRLADFAAALHDLLRELAILVAKDGEGITKFVTIEVEGAESDRAARRIGLSIGNSPLVKTAIAGEDANWGRVVMAVGKSGEAADRDKLSIRFGDILVAHEGERAPSYNEEEGRALYEGTRDHPARRPRHRRRPGHDLDLRSHARLYRHQRRLPQLSEATRPMDPSFWRERWKNKEIGFHQPEFRPGAAEVLAAPGAASGRAACSCRCAARASTWFGWRSRGTVSSARSLASRRSTISLPSAGSPRPSSTAGSFTVKSAGPYELWCGDIFDLPPEAAVDDVAALRPRRR